MVKPRPQATPSYSMHIHRPYFNEYDLTWPTCSAIYSTVMCVCVQQYGRMSAEEFNAQTEKRETLMCLVRIRWWFKLFLELHKLWFRTAHPPAILSLVHLRVNPCFIFESNLYGIECKQVYVIGKNVYKMLSVKGCITPLVMGLSDGIQSSDIRWPNTLQ